MNNKHVATEQELYFFKNRWEITEKNHEDELDPLLVPSLKLIGAHPKMAPVWCCEGHPEKGRRYRKGYVMIATTDRDVLDSLLDKIFELTSSNEKLNRYSHLWRISTTHRKFLFDQQNEDSRQWWKATIIAWDIPLDTSPSDWISILEEALSSI